MHVSDSNYDNLCRSLSSAGIQFRIKIKDLGLAIEEERQTIEKRQQLITDQKAFDFENYHTYEEVRQYMNQV